MRQGIESRLYERFSHEAPIIHAISHSKDYHAARMYNYSMEGMCFVSSRAIPPGTEIDIKMEYHTPMIYGPVSKENYRAKVRWCREVGDVYASYYGKYEIGVKYDLTPPVSH